jgi:hypothetical protein
MTSEVQEKILKRISGEETVPVICADPRMPSKATVVRFLAASSDESVKFRRRHDAVVASRDQLVALALAIADDASRDWQERRNENGEVDYVLSREQVVRDRHRIRLLHKTAAQLLPSVLARQGTPDL